MKKFFKKLSSVSQETKVGLTIALIAVIFFGGIGLSQRWWKPVESSKTSTNTASTSSTVKPNSTSSSNIPVVSPLDEIFGYPCSVSATVVRHFFDLNDDASKQAASIVVYQGKYLPSQGIDIVAADNSKFNVLATASGTILSKVQDAKYGLMITLKTAGDIKVVFSSLSSANVEVGDEIKKGTVIGKAGEAIFGSDLNKNHLHLEVFASEVVRNPENCFTKTLGEIIA